MRFFAELPQIQNQTEDSNHVTVRAAIFDLDGTLVDAFADLTEAVNLPLRARGLPEHPLEVIKGMVGDGAGKLIERATTGIDAAEVEKIRVEILDKYRENPADNAHVYPGIYNVLDDLLDWGIKLGILSNKPHEMALKTCDQLELTKYFEEIRGECPDNTPRKPDPGALLAMCERMRADRVVYVGDGAADGQVARNAGVPFVACLWGTRTREQLSVYNPVAIVEEPKDLHMAILDALSS